MVYLLRKIFLLYFSWRGDTIPYEYLFNTFLLFDIEFYMQMNCSPTMNPHSITILQFPNKEPSFFCLVSSPMDYSGPSRPPTWGYHEMVIDSLAECIFALIFFFSILYSHHFSVLKNLLKCVHLLSVSFLSQSSTP